jgi:hypothetical protein
MSSAFHGILDRRCSRPLGRPDWAGLASNSSISDSSTGNGCAELMASSASDSFRGAGTGGVRTAGAVEGDASGALTSLFVVPSQPPPEVTGAPLACPTWQCDALHRKLLIKLVGFTAAALACSEWLGTFQKATKYATVGGRRVLYLLQRPILAHIFQTARCRVFNDFCCVGRTEQLRATTWCLLVLLSYVKGGKSPSGRCRSEVGLPGVLGPSGPHNNFSFCVMQHLQQCKQLHHHHFRTFLPQYVLTHNYSQ